MTEERQLLEATIQGDTAAFEVLVQRYQNLVCAITFSGTRRIEASEELAQEAFFSVWRNLSNLKEPDKFRSWLCSIARNLVRNYHRERKPEVSLPEHHVDVADPDNGPLEQAVSREEIMILEQALNRIPIDYREPLVLFYRQGHSVRQVAEGLELNEATVKTRLHRGRQMLKDQTAALVERTLERTVPDARFTKAVMVGIGTGLAAGVAGTASAAVTVGTAGGATTSGGSVLSAASGLLSTLAGKIVVVAAAAVLTAGVAIYSYNNAHQQNSADQHASQVNSAANDQSSIAVPVTPGQEQELVEAVNHKADSLAVSPGIETEEGTETIQGLPPTRHPDWPGLDEPVDNIYMQTGSRQLWIQLPRKFRDENNHRILIDNAKDRIEVKKDNKTVQLSATLTNQDPPVYEYNRLLEQLEYIQFAYLFGRSQNGIGESDIILDYTFNEIGQEENGSLLIYKMLSRGIEDESKDVKAYVDASTLLPEKFVVKDADPNSPTKGEIIDEFVLDFAVIPDSVFEYVAKDDETVLPFRQQSGFSGQVVDTTGDPVVGADVFIHYFPVSGDYLTTKSDTNGNFEIKLPDKASQNVFLPVHYWATLPNEPNFVAWTILCTDDYFFIGNIRDYISGYGGDILQSDSKMQTVSEKENGVTIQVQELSTIQQKPVIDNIQLVMEPTGILGGYVTDLEGNVISNAKLSASFLAYDDEGKQSRFGSSNINWKFETISDSTGYYEFVRLPQLWKGCKITVDISAAGFVSERKEFKIEESLRYKQFDIALNPQRVTISGVLKDNYDVPLGHRSILLSAQKMNVRDLSTQTDPNGLFTLEGCPDVAGLKVRSSLSNDYPESGIITAKEELDSFLLYPNVSQEISYVAGQLEYFVELTAIRPETQVEVLVTDSAGKPLPEFKIKLDGYLASDIKGYKPFISYPWQHLKLEKRTDSNGRILFDNVPDMGGMTIKVSPSLSFTRELHALNGKQQEQQRLAKIDEAYKNKYQKMEVPVELVEGQTDYFVEVVVLTKEEVKEQGER